MAVSVVFVEDAPTVNKSRKNKGCDWRKCLKNSIILIMLTFLVVNFVWGLIEVAITFLIDFLVNHKEGNEGFTNFPSVVIHPITTYEHQKWEEMMLKDPNSYDPSDEELEMQKFRTVLIQECSTGENVTELDDACFDRPEEYIERNYFCAIIEHPERFQEAYKPLILRWMAMALLYFCTLPLFMFAFVWKSQCISLLTIYMLCQLVPFSLSISILVDIWVNSAFELCALDYIYNEFKTRVFFSIFTSLKLFLKLIELCFIIWYMWMVHVERKQKGFGVTSSSLGAGKHRVAPERSMAKVGNELLTSSLNPTDYDDEEFNRAPDDPTNKYFTLNKIKKEKVDKEKEKKKLSKQRTLQLRQSLRNPGDPELQADQILPD